MRYEVRLTNGHTRTLEASGFHPHGESTAVFYTYRARPQIGAPNDQWGNEPPHRQRQETVAMFHGVEEVIEVPEPEIGFPVTAAELGGVGRFHNLGGARLGDADGIPLQPEPWAAANPGNLE